MHIPVTLLHKMAETADKRGEAKLNTYLGFKYCSQGEYGKGKEYLYKALKISKEIGDKQAEGLCYKNLGTVLNTVGEYDKAKEYQEKATEISKENDETQAEAVIFCSIGDYNNAKEYYEKALLQEALSFETLGAGFQTRSEFGKAKEYFKKALGFRKEIRDRQGEARDYEKLGTLFQSLGDYVKAEEYHHKALQISKEIGDRQGEATDYANLGTLFQSLGDYVKAKEYHHKALQISKEIGDRKGEARDYEKLGTLFQSLDDYVKAEKYHNKALQISKEIGDRQGEARDYGKLGTLFQSLGDYAKAEEYHNKALQISKEIGDKNGEAKDYANLGTVFRSRSSTEYAKAEEYHKKELAIRKKIGDRQGEASSYENLGIVFQSLGEDGQAKRYHEKALAIRNEIGDRKGQASSYGNLGRLYEYFKAKEYFEKALAITIETGDRKGEAVGYGNLGEVFHSLCEYLKAREYFVKALAITKETGDRKGEAVGYGNLGKVFHSLGDYDKAEQYHRIALQLEREIGDRGGEGRCFGHLGTVFSSLGKFSKAEEYFEKARVIRKEIGDRKGEAEDLGNLGIALFHSLGEYGKAKEYLHAALRIRKEINDREGEAKDYGNLGTVLRSLGEYDVAKEHHLKAIELSKEIGNVEAELKWYQNLTQDYLAEGNVEEAFCYLFACLHKCENMRGLLTGNDSLKISLLEVHILQYWALSKLLCDHGHDHAALYVLELGRARALADLMSAQYGVKIHLSLNPKSWVCIERIILNERKCICLYYSYADLFLNVYVLGGHKPICFRQAKISDCVMKALNIGDVGFNLQSRNDRQLARIVEDDEDENMERKILSLSECYKLLIAPVVDLLEKPEIVIVPDRSLHRVPFAALEDENGRYLSETFRIRIVPSLTTLKLIQDSPADYHSETGALIVGDPEVGDVFYKGSMNCLCRLPSARREAEMIGQLLGVQPLLGERATKHAILQSIQSVSLIHIAAHGHAERGEIALAPPLQLSAAYVPVEGDYLLTMTDIEQVQLRAKLVVLSCCHTGRGEINSEGTVGIARAFLGSGARSVLVAFWALEDEATKTFMCLFYGHLVRGESASESLHQAQKWMRSNGFSDLRKWAPFMLIGDDVTFDSERRFVFLFIFHEILHDCRKRVCFMPRVC